MDGSILFYSIDSPFSTKAWWPRFLCGSSIQGRREQASLYKVQGFLYNETLGPFGPWTTSKKGGENHADETVYYALGNPYPFNPPIHLFPRRPAQTCWSPRGPLPTARRSSPTRRTPIPSTDTSPTYPPGNTFRERRSTSSTGTAASTLGRYPRPWKPTGWSGTSTSTKWPSGRPLSEAGKSW